MGSEDGGDALLTISVIGDSPVDLVTPPDGCPRRNLYLQSNCRGPKEGILICKKCPVSQKRGAERSSE